eukprot:Gb_39122 [translate_table: standard]
MRYRFIYNHFPSLQEEDIIGRTDVEIFSGAGVKESQDFKQEVLQRGLPAKREISFETELFGTKTFLIYVEPVFSKTGETIGVNYMGMDVTDQICYHVKESLLAMTACSLSFSTLICEQCKIPTIFLSNILTLSCEPLPPLLLDFWVQLQTYACFILSFEASGHRTANFLYDNVLLFELLSEFAYAVAVVAKREKLAKLREEIAVQNAMETELNKTIHITEETMRAKQMLATMSHEIRSPLTGVVSMAEILANTKLDPEQRQLLDVMMSSGDLVLQLINDILDLSKVESGAMKLEATKFRPREVVKHVLQTAAASLQKELTLEGLVEDEVPLEHGLEDTHRPEAFAFGPGDLENSLEGQVYPPRLIANTTSLSHLVLYPTC